MRNWTIALALLSATVVAAQQSQYVWVEGQLNPDGTFTAGYWTFPQGPGNPNVVIVDGRPFSGARFDMPQMQRPTWTPRYTPEERAAKRAARKERVEDARRKRKQAYYSKKMRIDAEREAKRAAKVK